MEVRTEGGGGWGSSVVIKANGSIMCKKLLLVPESGQEWDDGQWSKCVCVFVCVYVSVCVCVFDGVCTCVSVCECV